jgi:hypothetical protein
MEPGFENNNQSQQNIVGVDLDLVQEGEYYTVLILEDEPDTLSLLKSLFFKIGFSCFWRRHWNGSPQEGKRVQPRFVDY